MKIATLALTWLIAQAPGGVPPVPQSPQAGTTCDLHAGSTTLRGTLPPASKGDQVVSVAVMPETPLSLAYVRSLAIAFAPNRSDPKLVERAHSTASMNDALMVAVHQNDLVTLMHMARPLGVAFSCAALGPGKYLILATTDRAYRTKGDVSKYVAQSSKFEFFVAESVVGKHDRTAAPGRFYRLGETAGAS